METIQLSVDERVLKKFGEEKIRERKKGTVKKSITPVLQNRRHGLKVGMNVFGRGARFCVSTNL